MLLHAQRRASTGLGLMGLGLMGLGLVGLGLVSTAASPAAANPGGSSPAPAGQPWTWPVPRPEVLEAFDGPESAWSPGHRGIDLSGRAGDPIASIGPGTVAFVGQVAGIPVIAVDHPATGLRSTYQPVRPSVSVGQRVAAGEVIGLLTGNSGHCSGHCLHLGVKRPGAGPGGRPVYVDPLRLLARFAVLKPIRGPRHGDAPG
jgi:murein DD-endopeptidase MepM/ murein hydrolase activator NlpD